MKPLPMNLSSMKKIAGDKESSTFMHKDGHQIKVAHAALPTLQRKQLEKLPIHKADGGEMESLSNSIKNAFNTPTPAPTPEDKDAKYARTREQNTENVSPSMASYASGGDVSNNPKLQQSTVRNPPPKGQLEVLRQYAEGTPEVSQDSPSDQPASDQSSKHTININVGTPQQSPASIYGNQPAQVNVPSSGAPTQANPGLLNQNATANVPSAIRQEQALAPQQQAIDTQAGQAKAVQEKAYNEQAAAQAQQDQNHINDMKQHTDEFAQWMQANPVNENHWAETRALGKTGAAMSLFLAGFAGGLGNTGPMDFINNQINRDIDSQKSRVGQQKSIFDAYNKLYDNQNIASNLTKVSMNDMYAHKMNQIADQLATPQAKLNAQMFQAQKTLENQQILRQSAFDPGMDTAYGHAQQVTGKVQGQPQSQPPTNFQPKQQGDEASGSILSPDAERLYSTQAPAQLKAKGQENRLPELEQQFTQAQQADRLLNQLHDVHSKMGELAQEGGASGYIRRHDPSATVPLIGHALSDMLVQPATATQGNKEYDALRTRLVGDIASALQGTNVGSEEITKMVEDNMPERKDSAELRAKKERNIRLFIKNKVPRSVLNDLKMTQ